MGAHRGRHVGRGLNQAQAERMALSGGQQQRLCIAWWRSSPGALLDEPTSASTRFPPPRSWSDQRAQVRIRSRSPPKTCSRRRAFPLHCVHVPAADRVRRDRRAVPEARRKGNRGLHHRPVRLTLVDAGPGAQRERTHIQAVRRRDGGHPLRRPGDGRPGRDAVSARSRGAALTRRCRCRDARRQR